MRAPLLLLPLAAFVLSAGDAPPSRAGHYYLQGVMETGSELLLQPDGHFRWYLTYGALDLFAEGQWREEGNSVLLTARPTQDVPSPGFRTLRLTIDDRGLIPPDGHGAYMVERASE